MREGGPDSWKGERQVSIETNLSLFTVGPGEDHTVSTTKDTKTQTLQLVLTPG